MEKTKTISQVKSGLRLTVKIIGGFIVASMFFGGVAALFFPRAVNGDWWLWRHAYVTAPAFLIISMPIMFFTMDRWLKVMAGFLGLAVLNSLLMISSGHVLANRTMPISRLDALYLTLFYTGAAILAGTLKDQARGFVSRSSVMVFMFALASWFGFRAKRPLTIPINSTDFILMLISLFALLFAWISNRAQTRRGRSSSPQIGDPDNSPPCPAP